MCTYTGVNKDIPNQLMLRNNQAKHVDSTLVPNTDDAVHMYQSLGGDLTLFSEFGRDPLVDRQDLLRLREERYFERWPSFEDIFQAVVNNNNVLFRDSLLFYIDVSMQLAAQL